MFKRILEFGAKLVVLGNELEQNRNDIKELRRDLLNLTLLVQRLSDDIIRTGERESSARENLALQLENTLLKFERLLPETTDSGKSSKGKKSG
jgi:hypothetical protein